MIRIYYCDYDVVFMSSEHVVFSCFVYRSPSHECHYLIFRAYLTSTFVSELKNVYMKVVGR
jgi:hypothetical protein